jgi:hypothetical protein
VHRRALELQKLFGTVYYLSQSVIDNMAPGTHVFSIGGGEPKRMRYSDFALDGKKLKWAKLKTHVQMGKDPVFVLAEVGKRICKKAAKVKRP